jgi:hypothetical protein
MGLAAIIIAVGLAAGKALPGVALVIWSVRRKP